MKRSRGEEGPLCKMATQQEGAALGEGCAGRAGLGGAGAGDQRAPKGKRLGSGGRDLKIQRKGEGGCSGPAPIRREVDNRGKRRGFGKEELKKGEAKLQNNNSNLIQERFR